MGTASDRANDRTHCRDLRFKTRHDLFPTRVSTTSIEVGGHACIAVGQNRGIASHPSPLSHLLPIGHQSTRLFHTSTPFAMPCNHHHASCAHVRAEAAVGDYTSAAFTAAPEGSKADFNDLEGFAEPSAVKQYAPNHALEPVHMDIAIKFDFERGSIVGNVTHTIKCNSTLAALAKSLTLNAVAFEDVQVAGDGIESFEYTGKEIHIVWSKAFTKGEERKITVTYSVERPTSGLFFNIPSLDYPSNGTYVVTDHETERARYWLPCVDVPAVRTKLTFRLTAPAAFEAVANGQLRGSTVDGDLKTTIYELDFPCPSYLLCLAVGDFVSIEDRPAKLAAGRHVPIRYFGAKHMKAEDIKRDKLNTPLPWPKYYQFCSPFVGGAMENISLVSWGDFLPCDEIAIRDLGHFMAIVNVHELGHTWFGDMTVIRHFENAWQKESWATYCESLWIEDTEGAAAGRMYRFDDLESYISETGSYMRPIVSKRYDHSWSMNVETDDFRKVLEEFSGLNLTQFFDQWFHSKGFPKIKAKYEYDAERKFVTEDGKIHRTVASFDGTVAKTTAAIHTGAKPVHIEVDPDGFQVFDFAEPFKPSFDILLATAKSARDPVNRVRAYRALLKEADFFTLRKVSPIALAEPMPQVRSKIAGALAGLRHAPAVDLLVALAEQETNDVARTAIFTRLQFKHTKVHAFAKRLLHDASANLTYRQRANLLVALATQRDAADYEYVKAHAAGQFPDGVKDYRSMVQAAAQGALARFRTEQAARDLLAIHKVVINADVPHGLVSGSLSALSAASHWVPEPLARELAETLAEGLTYTKHFRPRGVAYGALKNVAYGLAAQHASAMEAALVLHAEQDHPD
ncbi:peptidase family M1-domain-containing protein [Catenaria anguillulae PL171]|uniref:Peptidase family M1-domain-containing protein n=1 Tax=Catenaria anguillulae PL171 TaxID=765915 RepID=A0A1Y2HW65_9FUNG|nr:peptidase family M1-domain-containing protein [Catenaria anguillulae PL171]